MKTKKTTSLTSTGKHLSPCQSDTDPVCAGSRINGKLGKSPPCNKYELSQTSPSLFFRTPLCQFRCRASGFRNATPITTYNEYVIRLNTVLRYILLRRHYSTFVARDSRLSEARDSPENTRTTEHPRSFSMRYRSFAVIVPLSYTIWMPRYDIGVGDSLQGKRFPSLISPFSLSC